MTQGNCDNVKTDQTGNWDKLVSPAPRWLMPLRTNVAVGILIVNHKITVYTHPPPSPPEVITIWPQLSIRSEPDIGMREVETENGEKIVPTPIIVWHGPMRVVMCTFLSYAALCHSLVTLGRRSSVMCVLVWEVIGRYHEDYLLW